MIILIGVLFVTFYFYRFNLAMSCKYFEHVHVSNLVKHLVSFNKTYIYSSGMFEESQCWRSTYAKGHFSQSFKKGPSTKSSFFQKIRCRCPCPPFVGDIFVNLPHPNKHQCFVSVWLCSCALGAFTLVSTSHFKNPPEIACFVLHLEPNSF